MNERKHDLKVRGIFQKKGRVRSGTIITVSCYFCSVFYTSSNHTASKNDQWGVENIMYPS